MAAVRFGCALLDRHCAHCIICPPLLAITCPTESVAGVKRVANHDKPALSGPLVDLLKCCCSSTFITRKTRAAAGIDPAGCSVAVTRRSALQLSTSASSKHGVETIPTPVPDAVALSVAKRSSEPLLRRSAALQIGICRSGMVRGDTNGHGERQQCSEHPSHHHWNPQATESSGERHRSLLSTRSVNHTCIHIVPLSPCVEDARALGRMC